MTKPSARTGGRDPVDLDLARYERDVDRADAHYASLAGVIERSQLCFGSGCDVRIAENVPRDHRDEMMDQGDAILIQGSWYCPNCARRELNSSRADDEADAMLAKMIVCAQELALARCSTHWTDKVEEIERRYWRMRDRLREEIATAIRAKNMYEARIAEGGVR